MQKIAVIVNAGSGTAGKLADLNEHLAKVFAANGIEADIKLAKSGAEFTQFAKEAAEGDHEIVVAGGGDGTVNGVAAEIVGTGKILGVLPLGTLNHFSKDLQIPQNIDEAVRVIGEGHTAEIDVGEVNGRIFLNNSSIGLYPRMVLRREKEQHRLGVNKWIAAFWATFATLRRHPFLDVRLGLENETLMRRTPLIFIGNNEYEMEGFNIGKRARLDGGKLSLYILHRTGRWRLIVLAIRSLFGKLRQAKEFEEILTEECEIETRRRKLLLVAFDGEVTAMKAPLKYRIRAKALKVIVNGE
jgi:YegS/Rv2252/BmrU family lipid kinase